METWNRRCEDSIRREKAAVEKKYGIKIGKTDITCTYCGKISTFFHTCQNMPPERKSEIEKIQDEFNRPVSLIGLQGWREVLGIELGMSKEEAIEKFLDWQVKNKTCERCEGEKYFDSCPIRLVCKEAMNYERDVERNDNGRGIAEINESQKVRIELSKTRQRNTIR